MNRRAFFLRFVLSFTSLGCGILACADDRGHGGEPTTTAEDGLGMVISAALEVSPRVDARATGYDNDPATACGASMCLTAWTNAYGFSAQRIFVRPIRPSGEALSKASRLEAYPPQTNVNVRLASNGAEEFLLVATAEDKRVFATRLDAAGAPINQAPIQLSEDAARAVHGQPAVAWNGEKYLIAWSQKNLIGAVDANVWGALFDPVSGTASAPFAISTGPGRAPAVAANAGRFLVAWRNEAGTHCSSIDGNGAATGPTMILDDARGRPSVAALGGDNFVVVASHSEVGADGAPIRGLRVHANGHDFGAIGLLGGAGVGEPVVVNRGGDAILLARSVEDSTLLRETVIGVDGVLSAPTAVSTAARPMVALEGAAAFAKDAKQTLHLVAARDGTSFSDGKWEADIEADYVANDGTIAPADRSALISNAPNSQTDPDIATNGNDFLVVWHDYRKGWLEPQTHAQAFGADGIAKLDGSWVAHNVPGADMRLGAPSVFHVGPSFVTVWSRGNESMDESWRYVGVRQTAQGAEMKALDAISPNAEAKNCSFASNGAELLALCNHGTMEAIRMDASFNVLSRKPVTIPHAPGTSPPSKWVGTRYNEQLAWNGTAYVHVGPSLDPTTGSSGIYGGLLIDDPAQPGSLLLTHVRLADGGNHNLDIRLGAGPNGKLLLSWTTKTSSRVMQTLDGTTLQLVGTPVQQGGVVSRASLYSRPVFDAANQGWLLSSGDDVGGLSIDAWSASPLGHSVNIIEKDPRSAYAKRPARVAINQHGVMMSAFQTSLPDLPAERVMTRTVKLIAEKQDGGYAKDAAGGGYAKDAAGGGSAKDAATSSSSSSSSSSTSSSSSSSSSGQSASEDDENAETETPNAGVAGTRVVEAGCSMGTSSTPIGKSAALGIVVALSAAFARRKRAV